MDEMELGREENEERGLGVGSEDGGYRYIGRYPGG